jgi:hypothetical protein
LLTWQRLLFFLKQIGFELHKDKLRFGKYRPAMKQKNEIVSANIQSMIFTIRGIQIMLDRDLAVVYGVETKVLNQAVKRNIDRFPQEFRFQLTESEYQELVTDRDRDYLRSHSVTSSSHGGRRYLPYVFTEQGVSMLSAVLRSETAVKVSIQIINAFVRMRRFLQYNAKVFERLESVGRRQLVFESETGKNFEKVFQALTATMFIILAHHSRIWAKSGSLFPRWISGQWRCLVK